MEIVNRSRQKKIPYTAFEIPKGMSVTEEERFFDKKREQWFKGVNGLSGRHVMYLDIGSLKTVTGEIVRPRFRDVDMEIFHSYDYSFEYHLDQMIVKRREIGLTSIFAGLNPIYECLMWPGSQNLLTSADSARSKSMFSDKTLIFYEGLSKYLPKRWIPEKLYERAHGYLNLVGEDGTAASGSRVICLETADSDLAAKKFENFRAKSIFLDELFLHPRANQVLSSSQACVMQGFEKLGHIVFGGSCGAEKAEDVATLKSNSQMVERMWKDSTPLGIHTMFIAGWKGIARAPELDDQGNKTGKMLQFEVNGQSDEKRATEWILKTRANLEKADDQTRYFNFIKNYPLTITEVFDIHKLGVLPPNIYAALSEAKIEAIKENSKRGGDRFTLHRNGEGQIVQTKNKKGVYIIVKEPEAGKTYISGTDPIPFNSDKIEQGSEYAISIKSIEDQEYVAAYVERNLDSDITVGNAILLQEHYKSTKYPQGAITNMEINMGSIAIKTYIDLGKGNLLADRPSKLGDIYIDKKYKKGWSNNATSGGLANNFLIAFLTKWAAKIRMVSLIEGISAWPSTKTDLVDSVKSCEILEANIIAAEKKKYGTGDRYTELRYYEYDSSGAVREKWHRVKIN